MQRFLMEFKDGSRTYVPARRIAEARARGAVFADRGIRATVGALDAAPMTGSITGGVAGGIAGPALTGAAATAFPPAAAALPASPMAGRISGGVAGGSLGKMIQEGGYRAMGLGDAPGTVAGEAATQAIMGPVGEAGGAVLGMGGRAVLRSGLAQKAGQGLKIVEEMVKERIPVGGARTLFGKTIPSAAKDIPVVGPLLVRGSNAAASHFERRLASRNAVNAAASAAGVRIPRQAAEDVITDLSTKISAEMGDDAELRFLQKKLAEWQNRKGADLDPREVQSIITRFDAKSKPIFAALERGENIPNAGMQARATYMRQVANALREVMRNSVPGLEAENAKLGAAAAVKAAVQRSEAVPTVARMVGRGTVGAGIGGAIGGYMSPDNRVKGAAEGSAIGGLVANNPATLSRLGLLMTDPALLALVRQSPRFFYGQSDR